LGGGVTCVDDDVFDLFRRPARRLARLQEIQLGQQRLKDTRRVVVLGRTRFDCCRLNLLLRTHLLLGRVDPRDHTVQEVEAGLQPVERRSSLFCGFSHHIQDEQGLR
jgi:hypothetical protein